MIFVRVSLMPHSAPNFLPELFSWIFHLRLKLTIKIQTFSGWI
ncbi:unnamed protein product [Brassica oleracea var. botrytis]